MHFSVSYSAKTKSCIHADFHYIYITPPPPHHSLLYFSYISYIFKKNVQPTDTNFEKNLFFQHTRV